MKIRLTPEIAYLAGAWKYARTREGIGVRGSEDFRAAFLGRAVQARVARPDEVQLKDDRLFFYHSAYRAFFDATLAREDEAFVHHNDFAAAFLAGLFDAVGGLENGAAYLTRWDKRDEMVLLRLNFQTLKQGGRLLVGPPGAFLRFISSWKLMDKTGPAGGGKTDRSRWMAQAALEEKEARKETKKEEKAVRRRRIYPNPPERPSQTPG